MRDRAYDKLMDDAARRYAAADKSDPFAYARARTHNANQVSRGSTKHGDHCYYDAEEGSETRKLPDGTLYQAPVYHSMVRP